MTSPLPTTLALLHEHITDFAHKLLLKRGTLPMTFFGIDSDLKMHVLPCWEYPKKREFYQSILRAYFAFHRIHTYAFASEAWVGAHKFSKLEMETMKATGPTMRMPQNLPMPSKDPERKEVVLSYACNRTEILTRTDLIIREGGKENGKIKGLKDYAADGPPIQVERYGVMDLLLESDPPEEMLKHVGTILKAVPMDQYFPGHLIISVLDVEKN